MCSNYHTTSIPVSHDRSDYIYIYIQGKFYVRLFKITNEVSCKLDKCNVMEANLWTQIYQSLPYQAELLIKPLNVQYFCRLMRLNQCEIISVKIYESGGFSVKGVDALV